MKIVELKGKSAVELKDMDLSLRRELFNLRFQKATGEATVFNRVREVRRDIARIQTHISQTRLGIVIEAKATREKPVKKAKAPKPAKAEKEEAEPKAKAKKAAKAEKPVKKAKAKAEKPVKKVKKG
jgi:large subunit ribosomal protein L29